MSKQLRGLFSALQERLSTDLKSVRTVVEHPGGKGAASEANWLNLLSKHLPHRYAVDSAFVVDSEGTRSDQIDIVIYDRQYTPILCDLENQLFIPAESVYAALEVKQVLNKGSIEYAGRKIVSIRRLTRTSMGVVHAGGEYEPKPPTPVLGGVVTLECGWSPPFGASLMQVLASRSSPERIDLACALTAGSFTAEYDPSGEVTLSTTPAEHALVGFLFTLLERLQRIGTVTAADFGAYRTAAMK